MDRSYLRQAICVLVMFVCAQYAHISLVLVQDRNTTGPAQEFKSPTSPLGTVSKRFASRRSNTVEWSKYYPRQIHTRRSFHQNELTRFGPRKPPETIHECACLGKKSNRKPVKLLDIPGASLFIAYWNQGFPDLNLDYNIARGELYDFDIQERYPIELYANNNVSMFAARARNDFQNIAAIFPDPMERMVSLYELISTRYKDLMLKCRRWHLECYATYPGVANGTTKILLGHSRFKTIEMTESNQNQAILNLRKLDFIAVEEEWNEAVCQYHKTFGGLPHQGAFRPSGYQKEPVKILNELRETYQPDFDSILYEEARKEFYNRYLPKGDRQRCYRKTKLKASSRTSCWPTSCMDIGKQCGEWPDGCGGVLVCGQCPKRRSGLPGSWHVECSDEGQCIPTCPWWVENGIWFEDSSGLMDRLELAGAPSNLGIQEFASIGHMTPSDAVWLCTEACERTNEKNVKNFVDKFCHCGDPPYPFLAKSPIAADYRKIMDLVPEKVDLFDHEFPRRSSTVLTPKHSQPKCCQALDSAALDDHWVVGIQDADYFATHDMGCRNHVDCERLGREMEAEVVAFSASSHLCHLGKNVRTRENLVEGSTFQGSEKVYRLLSPNFSFLKNIAPL